MKSSHIRKGREGEERAQQYLRGKGYTILETNFRALRKEIDIIARLGEEMVFVEVKTRRTRDFGDPTEAVDRGKQRRIRQAALSYLQQKSLQEAPCRFDVISIVLCTGELEHIEQAF
ncbi:MAG: YraN family protein [Candidatus Eremiobacteraeota bacterium]|nr:YraN family protein [Candidatus Eremiobacteraeota bacterium]